MWFVGACLRAVAVEVTGGCLVQFQTPPPRRGQGSLEGVAMVVVVVVVVVGRYWAHLWFSAAGRSVGEGVAPPLVPEGIETPGPTICTCRVT